jgi:hypothetical protein
VLSQSGADVTAVPRILDGLGPEEKVELLRQVERVARGADPRVKDTDLTRYVDTYGTTALANGTYTVTVVDTGAIGATLAYKTVLSSGATFTVADF